ncbi:MAG: hypothetical protein EG826_09225 [Deltaproteobacteria bacterium]|nr:hypothetical protein [Deltaproteobacteria bacterium]
MGQQTPEQEWNQLVLRINNFTNALLKEDIPAIEHKSNVVALLSAPQAQNRKSKVNLRKDTVQE